MDPPRPLEPSPQLPVRPPGAWRPVFAAPLWLVSAEPPWVEESSCGARRLRARFKTSTASEETESPRPREDSNLIWSFTMPPYAIPTILRGERIINPIIRMKTLRF